MFKRVIYIVKSDLAFYPPCMSQIRMIKIWACRLKSGLVPARIRLRKF